jgi:hypothetical protein
MLLYFPQEMVFPASLENLTLFIAFCFQKKLASSTVLTSAISFLLQLGGYEDLPGHFIISKALRGYHNEKAAKDSIVATFCICFKVAECPLSSLLKVDPSMEILL